MVLLLSSTPWTHLSSLPTSTNVQNRFLRLRETTYLSSLAVVVLLHPDPGLISYFPDILDRITSSFRLDLENLVIFATLRTDCSLLIKINALALCTGEREALSDWLRVWTVQQQRCYWSHKFAEACTRDKRVTFHMRLQSSLRKLCCLSIHDIRKS